MSVRIRVRIHPRPLSRLLIGTLALCVGTFSLLVSATIENSAAKRAPVPPFLLVDSIVPPLPGPIPVPSIPSPGTPRPCGTLTHAQLNRLIGEAAQRHAVSSILLLRVILQESGGRPCAVSPKGATGLMGLMPVTARHFGVHATSPEENIDAGARYLRILLQKYGNDFRLALAAYNAGPGRVDQYRGVPPYRETRNYVARILGE